MSKNSARQRVTQLMEWMTTLKSQRRKPTKSNGNRQRVNGGFSPTSNISSRDVRIKNGPSGRR